MNRWLLKTTVRLLCVIGLLIFLVGCTQQERAKTFGGSATVELPKGMKLEVATWKNDDLWYLYRPMRDGEVPEVHVLQESSSFGLVEGNVTFKESK